MRSTTARRALDILILIAATLFIGVVAYMLLLLLIGWYWTT
jgi:hypothetical protein